MSVNFVDCCKNDLWRCQFQWLDINFSSKPRSNDVNKSCILGNRNHLTLDSQSFLQLLSFNVWNSIHDGGATQGNINLFTLEAKDSCKHKAVSGPFWYLMRIIMHLWILSSNCQISSDFDKTPMLILRSHITSDQSIDVDQCSPVFKLED